MLKYYVLWMIITGCTVQKLHGLYCLLKYSICSSLLRILVNRMFANQFGLVLSTFLFIFTTAASPIFASTPADKSWEDLEQRGTAALDANQYGVAEPLLQKALVQSENFRPLDMRLAKSVAELGRLYTIRGQFSRAALYLESELKVKEKLLRYKQYECIPTMASLIQFYFNYGTQNKSLPLTEKMLSLIENRSKSKQAPMIEWAIACDAVGDRYYSAHNFALADKLFKTALNIKTTLLSSNHLSLANSYERMGSLCLEKNDLSQAEQYFSNALRITEKILPPESPEVHTRLNKLAKCRILQKKYGQAEKLYLQAQNVSQNKNEKSDERTKALYDLGCLYTEEHKYKLALSYFQQSLELAKLDNGSNSSTLASCLEKIDLIKSAQRETSVKKASIAPARKAEEAEIPFVVVVQKNTKNL